MKKIFFLLFLISLSIGCETNIEERFIKSVLFPDDPFNEGNLYEFIIPPPDLTKNIEPDIVLRTDRKRDSWHHDIYPIFDNLEAAIVSLKVMQEYIKGECDGWGKGFVGDTAVRYKMMLCHLYVGSLTTGDCLWKDSLRPFTYDFTFAVGFTSRALRDEFIDSVPYLFNEDVWWEVVNTGTKQGSYMLDRRINLWVTYVDDSMRGRYRYYNGMSLDIALPDGFPVFGLLIFAGGTRDEVCKRNALGMLW